jgi:hypothetical protein
MDIHNVASKGVANAGLTTGIIGTSLGALNAMGGAGGLLGGLFGGGCNGAWNMAGCSENVLVNRYELGQAQEIEERANVTLEPTVVPMSDYEQKRSLLLLHVAVMLFGLSGVLGKWVTVPAYAVAGEQKRIEEMMQALGKDPYGAYESVNNAMNALIESHKCEAVTRLSS